MSRCYHHRRVKKMSILTSQDRELQTSAPSRSPSPIWKDPECPGGPGALHCSMRPRPTRHEKTQHFKTPKIKTFSLNGDLRNTGNILLPFVLVDQMIDCLLSSST